MQLPHVERVIPGSEGTQAVDRALRLLRTLAEQRTPLRVSDVARMCEIGVSTASRLLGTLERQGFVERASGLFRLGEVSLSLAGAAMSQSHLYRASAPVAFELAAKYRLGVHVARRSGDTALYLLSVAGERAASGQTLLGSRRPLHATALGKSLLADASADELSELESAAGLPIYTPNTIHDVASLGQELERISRRGYSTEVEELALGRACIAAPVRGFDHKVIAALSLAGPKSVLDLAEREEDLAQAVIEGADRIGLDCQPFVSLS